MIHLSLFVSFLPCSCIAFVLVVVKRLTGSSINAQTSLPLGCPKSSVLSRPHKLYCFSSQALPKNACSCKPFKSISLLMHLPKSAFSTLISLGVFSLSAWCHMKQLPSLRGVRPRVPSPLGQVSWIRCGKWPWTRNRQFNSHFDCLYEGGGEWMGEWEEGKEGRGVIVLHKGERWG